jgi:endonuclease YncB( thermonuclease family)
MNVFRFLICAALLSLATLANAQEFAGKVIAVMDGDTLLILRDGHPVKVRLAEIDAPEKAQPFGAASQKSLAEMVKDEQVRVVSNAADDYGRLIARVYVGEFNVNYEQVWRGMAWEYSRFHGNKELMALQHQAQQARRGLWAQRGAVEPSQWRKQHPDARAPKRPSLGSPAAPAASASPSAATLNSGQDCSKKHCSQMSSCEEAMRYFSVCGKKSLDGNADGMPCESLCTTAGNKIGRVQ